MSSKGTYQSVAELSQKVAVARGLQPADLVIKGVHFLDVFTGVFAVGDVAVHQGTIVGIGETYEGKEVVFAEGQFLVPGFIDSHVHIESSLLTPRRFEEAVLPEGTTTAIWDPHEIANVKGLEGIRWAISEAERLAMDVRVMVPSCVPSTSPELGLETSGATLTAADLLEFRGHPKVLGLAEMMNYPGLLNGDPDVHAKLDGYKGMLRDGHCPGLSGKDLNAYGVAGISTCHESTQLGEAREKLQKGIHVWIREGSCAKDADELLPLLTPRSSAVLGFCSDDRNPLDIAHEGHINCIVNKALSRGLPPEDVFRAASFGPSRVYGLMDRGVIAPGYLADLVLVKQKSKGDWTSGITIAGVWKTGRRVALGSQTATAPAPVTEAARQWTKNIKMTPVTEADFKINWVGSSKRVLANVIGVRPRQIITDALNETLAVDANRGVLADVDRDVLKIAVFERHHDTGRRSVAFVKGMGIKCGAIATSINHDSHNCIVVGSSDQAMTRALNGLIELDGGIFACHDHGETACLSLPIGGLMTDAAPGSVTESLVILKKLAQAIGCFLEEPFLQLSFLALPVIPTLKITDRGLVDVRTFKLIPLCQEVSK